MDHENDNNFEYDQNVPYEPASGVRRRDRRAWDKRRGNDRRDQRKAKERERGGF